MKAYIDIENAHTKKVDTLELDILSNEKNTIIFDISKLNLNQLEMLKNAIDKELRYTDIELFYIGEDNIPYFGPDYDFSINDDYLKGENRKKDLK